MLTYTFLFLTEFVCNFFFYSRIPKKIKSNAMIGNSPVYNIMIAEFIILHYL